MGKFLTCTLYLISCIYFQVLRKYATEWISSITDITDFVTAQKSVLDNQGIESLLTAKEEVYPVASEAVREKIGLD